MKKIGVLIGAAVFDLGVIAISGQAAQAADMFLKWKLDAVKTAAACTKDGGTVVDENGQKYCQTTKPAGAAPQR
jgi:hypothetical protein